MQDNALRIGLVLTSLACTARSVAEGTPAAYEVAGKTYEGFCQYGQQD